MIVFIGLLLVKLHHVVVLVVLLLLLLLLLLLALLPLGEHFEDLHHVLLVATLGELLHQLDHVNLGQIHGHHFLTLCHLISTTSISTFITFRLRRPSSATKSYLNIRL